MAGYSQTPLIKKLGIKPDFKILILGEPSHYFNWISPLPERVKVVRKMTKEEVDFIHLFQVERKIFEQEFITLKKMLRKEGMLWISWPKKTSKVPTDLNENIIREYGLANGLVDVKVCAVDDVWSALKFMYRLKDR